MKLKVIALSLALLTVASASVKAQQSEASRIKILATAQPGVVMVIYAMETTRPVQVKFSDRNGVVTTDKIRGHYSKGVSKKYDVSKIEDKEYWVEVSSQGVSVTYHIIPSVTEENKFTAYLQKSSIDRDMVAKNY